MKDGAIVWVPGLTSMQETPNARTAKVQGLNYCHPLWMSPPHLSFFLYVIHYAWAVREASDTAVPFLAPYRCLPLAKILHRISIPDRMQMPMVAETVTRKANP